MKCSPSTGRVPKECKKTRIVPVYKSGEKEEPPDCRPASLTSTVWKVCEKLTEKHWTEVVEKHDIYITEKQYSFRQKAITCNQHDELLFKSD